MPSKSHTYWGVFPTPRFHFFTEYVTEFEPSIYSFWKEVGFLVEVIRTYEFPYRDLIIEINCHKCGYISINETEITDKLNITFKDSNFRNTIYLIISSFLGCTDYYYISTPERNLQSPIGGLNICKNTETVTRRIGNGRATFAIVQLEILRKEIINTKAHINANIEGVYWRDIYKYSEQLLGEKNLTNFEQSIKNKETYKFEDEYYFLVMNIHKSREEVNNVSLLVYGWTACEYLINYLFDYNVNDTLKERRKSFFHKKEKVYKWAFREKNGNIRGYSDLIGCLNFDIALKMEILTIEEKITATNEYMKAEKSLFDELVKLRNIRNRFVHSPSSKMSLQLLKESSENLFQDIWQCIMELKEIIKCTKA